MPADMDVHKYVRNSYVHSAHVHSWTYWPLNKSVKYICMYVYM